MLAIWDPSDQLMIGWYPSVLSLVRQSHLIWSWTFLLNLSLSCSLISDTAIKSLSIFVHETQSISPLRRSFHLCHLSFHTVIWLLTLSKTSETGRDWWMRRKFENCSAGLKFSTSNQLNFILEFLSFGHPFRLDFSNLWDLNFLFLFSYDALCLMVNMRNNTTFLSSLLHFWIIGFHDFSL